MSIKGFHIVFITISTLLFLFLTVWAFAFAPERTGVITGLGIAASAGLLVMPFYGVYFYRKIRNSHL